MKESQLSQSTSGLFQTGNGTHTTPRSKGEPTLNHVPEAEFHRCDFENIHPTLRVTFVPLPTLGFEITQTQLDEVFAGDRKALKQIVCLKPQYGQLSSSLTRDVGISDSIQASHVSHSIDEKSPELYIIDQSGQRE